MRKLTTNSIKFQNAQDARKPQKTQLLEDESVLHTSNRQWKTPPTQYFTQNQGAPLPGGDQPQDALVPEISAPMSVGAASNADGSGVSNPISGES